MRWLAGLLGVVVSTQVFAAGVVCEIPAARPTMLSARLEVMRLSEDRFAITFRQRYLGPGGALPETALELGDKHRCVFGDHALFACDENPLDSRDRFNSYVVMKRELNEFLQPGNPRLQRSEEFVVSAYTEATRELARRGSDQVDAEGRMRIVFLKGDCQRVP